MPAFPKTDDVNKVREQAQVAFGEAVEQARTPLLAALGAGDLAARTVTDALTKLRTELNERAEGARQDLPTDLAELRERLDPAELRKRVDGYAKSARQLYDYLAERGEETWQRLQSQPQVKRAWSQVGVVQDKAAETAEQAGDIADDVLGKVSRSARSAGEKAAEKAESAADTAREAGEEAASTARSTARKTASRTDAAKSKSSKKSAAKSDG
ncbi:hypothetical protein [Saccharopolyspora rosea]|uniref:Heparin binding hemagglutinin HbhA n=1 Tax=Saccharopolyspora rosea TaxID=524884 RepID=A0ABW3FJR4_9PSEU|nr:hypothetical protein [Saccharopolyspora rosea]